MKTTLNEQRRKLHSKRKNSINEKRRELHLDRKESINEKRREYRSKTNNSKEQNNQTILFPPIITNDIKKTCMANFNHYMKNIAFKFHVCCVRGQIKQIDHIQKYCIILIDSTLKAM
jgi:hypothetical protein